MNNIAVKHGIYGGLLVAAFILIQYFTGTLASMWMGFIPLVLSIVIVVLGARNTKKAQGGVITFKDGFIAALTTGIVISAFSVLTQFLLFNVIDPELPNVMLEELTHKTVEMMEKFGAPDDVIDGTIGDIQQSIKDTYTPMGLMLTFLKGIIFNAFLALIIALIIKSPGHVIAQKDSEILDI